MTQVSSVLAKINAPFRITARSNVIALGDATFASSPPEGAAGAGASPGFKIAILT